jgi:selenium-dependent xanthine dehydrogenase
MEKVMEFVLNGRVETYSGDEARSLMDYLRNEAGIISPKDGCAPQAACGCCTVQLNGKAVLSCVTPMKKVAQGEVYTTEGLGDYLQQTFAHAFVEKGAVQCGFCIPGMVMRARALIQDNPQPTRADIEKALTLHLCRCTGYKKIVEAIQYAAAAIHAEEEIPQPSGTGRVGTRQPKYEALDRALGLAPYVADLKFPGVAYGALKFSDHPRALVQKMNVAPATAMPGVLRVLTAADIPGERQVGLIIPDWPVMVAEGEMTRYIGDVLAVVVAESEAQARAAVEQIQITYDVHEPVTDMHAALLPDSPRVHTQGNVLSQTKINRGDVDQALAEAAFISQDTYQTQRIEHGFMEPECCIARPGPEGSVEVYSQGQGVYEDQQQLAAILDLPLEKVRVILVPNGGGFGGKEDLSVQGHAALAAHLLNRPVKITLTREESICLHPKRHPLHMEYTMACDEQGRLTAVRARIVGDTGAYASVGMKVLERAAGHSTGAYHIPNVDVVSTAVYTNNIPNGAMRGFGVNQVTFAIESCLDDLCTQGGFDRWQFRYDNAIADGRMTATGQIIDGGAGLRETLLAVKEPFYAAKYAGLACGIKNTGIGNGMPDAARVKIEIVGPENIIIHHGWTEMGQGVHTMAVQAFCEETGLAPDLLTVQVDTAAQAKSGMTTASRATSLVGNAIIEACKLFKTDLQNHTLAELTGRTYTGEWICDWTTKPGKGQEEITHYSYSYATQLVTLDEQGNVEKIIAAHDAGKIFNPTLFEGQLEGSIHMGLGYALTEDLEMEGGRPVSTRLRSCGILRAKEMPEMEIIGIEVPDPHGPYGAKGVGEIGLVPTAGAVANALAQFDGHRRTTLPLKEKRLPRR